MREHPTALFMITKRLKPEGCKSVINWNHFCHVTITGQLGQWLNNLQNAQFTNWLPTGKCVIVAVIKITTVWNFWLSVLLVRCIITVLNSNSLLFVDSSCLYHFNVYINLHSSSLWLKIPGGIIAVLWSSSDSLV